jgi:hypothetical protein
MERYSLKRFPERLRSIADQIESVNRHPLFDLLHQSAKDRLRLFSNDPPDPNVLSQTEWLGRAYGALPGTLRSYGTFLESSLGLFGYITQKHPRCFDSRKMWECTLLDYVRSSAGGRHHAADVALLLTATFEAAGIQDVTFTPDALTASVKRTPSHLRQAYRRLWEET